MSQRVAPKTQYARHGDLNLAYQVAGEGDVDVVIAPSFVSNVDFYWAHPAIKSFLDRISSFSRLLLFDKGGTGLSDPVSEIPTLEQRADEIEAVMDAAGIERAAIFGLSEGAPAAVLFSVTRPERTEALVLFGGFPVGFGALIGEDSPDKLRELIEREFSPDLLDHVRRAAIERGFPPDDVPDEAQIERYRGFGDHALNDWGEGKALKQLVPNMGDEGQLGLMERLCASPGMVEATVMAGARLDVTDLLESVAVPTLVVHARDDLVPVQGGRMMAERIPGARMIEVEGQDHAPWWTEPERIIAEIEELLTGQRHAPRPQRVLATVLFTDIVGSTEQAAKLGDARWRAVLERHDEVTARQVSSCGGKAVKSTGDGFLATFEGPAAGIQAAEAIRDSLAAEDVQVRAGLHTGEIERIEDDVGGIAVHIAARVCAEAGPGEILVSRTIRDLVVGSGLGFEDRGTHELKGVPGAWQLLAVAPPDSEAGRPERELSAIEIGSRHSTRRRGDRAVAAILRRAPGAVRAAIRLDPRYRRAVKQR
jgi:pimeloyl-ACP methyl ester carboxylesterase